jgi:opacity protein-like surface antigen
MMLTRNVLCLMAMFALVTANAIPAKADDWQHQVGITAFAFGMEGHAGVKGIEAKMDLGITDVLDDLDGALTLLVQGSNNSWGYWLSYEYVGMSDNTTFQVPGDNTTGQINGKAIFGTEIIDGGFAWNVPGVEWLELIGGARGWILEERFRSKSSTIFGNNSRSIQQQKEWVDAIVGIRAKFRLADQWSTMIRADAGAGDSDSTYQALAMLNYEINDHWTTGAGVRYLSVDYSDGGFLFDMDMSGFELAVLYSF